MGVVCSHWKFQQEEVHFKYPDDSLIQPEKTKSGHFMHLTVSSYVYIADEGRGFQVDEKKNWRWPTTQDILQMVKGNTDINNKMKKFIFIYSKASGVALRVFDVICHRLLILLFSKKTLVLRQYYPSKIHILDRKGHNA